MANLLKFPADWETKRQQFDCYCDFETDIDAAEWTVTASDAGTGVVGDEVGGILTILPADGATNVDNDETYFSTPNELFKYAADKPFVGGARVQFTETAAGIYNCGIWFANAPVADTLIDNGGGMRASGSLAAIYKVDGGTNWVCTTRNNGVVNISTSSLAAGGAAFANLEIEVLPFSSTQVKVVFRVDGVSLKDSTTGLDIVHTVTVASATEMAFGGGAKLGAATNNDAFKVDAAWYAGTRANL